MVCSFWQRSQKLGVQMRSHRTSRWSQNACFLRLRVQSWFQKFLPSKQKVKWVNAHCWHLEWLLFHFIIIWRMWKIEKQRPKLHRYRQSKTTQDWILQEQILDRLCRNIMRMFFWHLHYGNENSISRSKRNHFPKANELNNLYYQQKSYTLWCKGKAFCKTHRQLKHIFLVHSQPPRHSTCALNFCWQPLHHKSSQWGCRRQSWPSW